MDKTQLKKAVCSAIDARRDEIVRSARTMQSHPELGYKETLTSAMVRKAFEGLGLPVRTGLALTGVDGTLKCDKPGPVVVVMGELDSVVGRGAPGADPVTGAAHLCGHHIQVATMLGAAMGLVDAGLGREAAGTVRFLATPAEEYLEIEYRLGLKEEGKITFLGGKPELIKLGYFDDVDAAMMVHSFPNAPEAGFYLDAKGNGFLAKTVVYEGKPAHAGAAPHEGVNALNAACLGILAVHAQRETFRDEDAIRVHPIITKGGDIVNIVPADVRLETYVRGRTVQAIIEAAAKVDRALRAGGDAVGAGVKIRTVPGYLPLAQDANLTAIAAENGRALLGDRGAIDAGFLGGSFDVGDLAQLLPVLHPCVGGSKGALHTNVFEVVDYDAAAVLPAKLMALCVVDLLMDGAAEMKRVKAAFKPALTKAEYLAMMAKLEA